MTQMSLVHEPEQLHPKNLPNKLKKLVEETEKFQKGEIKYFIGQPRTGGYGLTLTNAKTVIYFNNTYDMEVRLQSEDRAHRIGQKDKVLYIDFVCPKTLDEKIIETLSNKKKLADQITGDNWKELFS